MSRTISRLAAIAAICLGGQLALAQAVEKLDLTTSEIAAVAVQGQVVALKLKPEAAQKLQAFTRKNLGKSVEVAVDGIAAFQAVASAEISSGVVHLDNPSAQLRSRLESVKGLSSEK